MPQTLRVHDLDFQPYLAESDIQERVRTLAARINLDYEGKNPVFVAVLNGAFMFAADLFRHVAIACEITFIKVASYEGTESTGQVNELIGMGMSVADRHVVVVEDIVDSGKTMQVILAQLEGMQVASVNIASLLLKPERLQFPVDIAYLGFEVPDKFLLGYGLDYDGQGRNLRDIYEPLSSDTVSPPGS